MNSDDSYRGPIELIGGEVTGVVTDCNGKTEDGREVVAAILVEKPPKALLDALNFGSEALRVTMFLHAGDLARIRSGDILRHGPTETVPDGDRRTVEFALLDGTRTHLSKFNVPIGEIMHPSQG